MVSRLATTWIIHVYSPYDLSERNITLEAAAPGEARKKAVGRTATDASGYKFEIEEHNIISVYPFKTVESLPYKTPPLDPAAKPAPWLLGAWVTEDKPLPVGSTPVGSPKLKQTIYDDITSLIYEQSVKSKQYPALQFHIQYRQDIFTKFLEEARRIKKVGKIPEAVLYLIEHCPGITVRMIADILEIGYWTAYREVAKLAKPTAEQIRRILKEAEESAEIERWIEKEERIVSLRTLFEEPTVDVPKVLFSSLWRKQLTIYPTRRRTEEELLAEARRIYTLNGYMPTEEEWRKAKEAIRKQTDAVLRQKIEYYLKAKK